MIAAARSALLVARGEKMIVLNEKDQTGYVDFYVIRIWIVLSKAMNS